MSTLHMFHQVVLPPIRLETDIALVGLSSNIMLLLMATQVGRIGENASAVLTLESHDN
jgi:hypothetical protein